jgi:hypothetical protein
MPVDSTHAVLIRQDAEGSRPRPVAFAALTWSSTTGMVAVQDVEPLWVRAARDGAHPVDVGRGDRAFPARALLQGGELRGGLVAWGDRDPTHDQAHGRGPAGPLRQPGELGDVPVLGPVPVTGPVVVDGLGDGAVLVEVGRPDVAEQTDEWADGRRYLGLEVLARCRQNPTTTRTRSTPSSNSAPDPTRTTERCTTTGDLTGHAD